MKSANQTHVLNFGHLHFDIVSDSCPPKADRISGFGFDAMHKSLPNKMIRSRPILVRLRRNPCVLCPASCPFDFCRESSTNPPFSCKTNPISKTLKITASPGPAKDYENEGPSARPKNKPNQSQNKPNFSLARGPQSQSKPKQTQFRNPTNPPPADNPATVPEKGRCAGGGADYFGMAVSWCILYLRGTH